MPTEIIVACISTFGGLFVGFILTELKNAKTQKNVSQKALKILLRRELREQCCDCVKKGYITDTELLEYTDALSVYESLIGKNDFVNKITETIMALPNKNI